MVVLPDETVFEGGFKQRAKYALADTPKSQAAPLGQWVKNKYLKMGIKWDLLSNLGNFCKSKSTFSNLTTFPPPYLFFLLLLRGWKCEGASQDFLEFTVF